MFDIDSLTLGEIAKVEDISKTPITKFGDEDTFMGRMSAALAYVVKRRTDPTFQFDQAMDLTQAEFNELLGIEADEDEDALDPTRPEATPATPNETPVYTNVESTPSSETSGTPASATSPSSWSPDSSI